METYSDLTNLSDSTFMRAVVFRSDSRGVSSLIKAWNDSASYGYKTGDPIPCKLEYIGAVPLLNIDSVKINDLDIYFFPDTQLINKPIFRAYRDTQTVKIYVLSPGSKISVFNNFFRISNSIDTILTNGYNYMLSPASLKLRTYL